MAYIAMACIVVVHIAMAYIAMAYIAMAQIVMAYLTQAQLAGAFGSGAAVVGYDDAFAVWSSSTLQSTDFVDARVVAEVFVTA